MLTTSFHNSILTPPYVETGHVRRDEGRVYVIRNKIFRRTDNNRRSKYFGNRSTLHVKQNKSNTHPNIICNYFNNTLCSMFTQFAGHLFGSHRKITKDSPRNSWKILFYFILFFSPFFGYSCSLTSIYKFFLHIPLFLEICAKIAPEHETCYLGIGGWASK